MNEQLLHIIQDYIPLEDLKKRFAFDAQSLKTLVKELVELEEAGLIVQVQDGYDLAKNQNVYAGTLSINKKGYGFVYIESFDDDVFIPERELHASLDRDEVLVKLKMEDNVRLAASFIKTLKRPHPIVIGVVKGKFVVPDMGVIPRVRLTKMNLAKENAKVQVLITNVYAHRFEGHIIEVLGDNDDPGMDITSTAVRYQFPLVHSAEAVQQANAATMHHQAQRRDLRSLDLVTIDGADAKDFDDAVHARRTENGFEVTVAIADVAEFVTADSPLDKEAYARGTSVYLADRVIPMLPEALSNELCSLKPMEDRYCVAVTMQLDDQARLVSHELYEGLMQSKRRFTYEEVNHALRHPASLNEDAMSTLLGVLQDVAQRRMKLRHQRGSLFFSTHESKITLDASGTPIDVRLVDRGQGEALIEELMLLANETVAEHCTQAGLPILYRTHDDPDPVKLMALIKFIRMRGVAVKGTQDQVHVKELQQVLERIVDHPGGAAIASLMIRSMAKAVYEPYHKPHYGLASKTYAHFTSPIRRYPDLIVHRHIKHLLRHGLPSTKEVEVWFERLVTTGHHASKKERDAVSCERDVTQMKMAEYMQSFIGRRFDGVVSGVTNFGLFVELANGIEGLVRKEDMKDDQYRFDPDRLVLVGRRLKRVYTIGDKVKVTCVNASKASSRIDFELLVKGAPHASSRRTRRRKKQKSAA
jgi:ribonuclease R